MDPEREVYRILAGKTRCVTPAGTVWVIAPNLEHRYLAAEIYAEALQQAEEIALTQVDAEQLLRRRGCWTVDDDSQYQLLNDKIEELKIGLFEAWNQTAVQTTIREGLARCRTELARLDAIKYSLSHLTAETLAITGKTRYLMTISLLQSDGQPLAPAQAEDLVEDVMESLVAQRLDEAEIRRIVQSDPWRSIWSTRKQAGRGLIDCDATALSDELRHLITWSMFYDSVHEHPHCPVDEVIADNDTLDGWWLKQIRDRKKQTTQRQIESLYEKNEKIRNADEVFLPIGDYGVYDTSRIDEINALNSDFANRTKQERYQHLKTQKEVQEQEMPDTARKYQMALNQMAAQQMRKK